MEKVVIVGAGPAGLLLAHRLLQHSSYQIEIYERRSDPRLVTQSQQRTFPISLQTRGLAAIRTVPNLEAAIAPQGIWSQGAYLHSKRGKSRAVTRKTPQLLIDRHQLSLTLLEALVQRDRAHQVTLHFDRKCLDIDPIKQQIIVVSSSGETLTVQYDRLVAADGVKSQVRTSLVERGVLQCEESTAPDAYRSLSLRQVNEDGSIHLTSDRIHSWSLGKGIRVVTAPQPNQLLEGVLIFPKQRDPLAHLTSAEAVLDFLRQQSPTLAQLMTAAAAEALRQCSVSKVFMVRCDRLHSGDRILLIGDAVHAVSPSIGQGCNSALQDVQVFADLLEQCGHDWAQALPAFTARRLPEVHALRELSDYTFPRSKLMMLELILRLTVGRKLKPVFPQLAKPLPMELVQESHLTYTEVLEQTRGWIERVKRSQSPNSPNS